MQLPSLTLVLSTTFVVYILHSMWTLAQLFTSLKCTQTPCFTSYLATNPKLQLILFTSVTNNPSSNEVTEIATINKFNYKEEFQREINVKIPNKTRQNGTMYLHVILASDNGLLEWSHLQRDGPTVIQRVLLTDYIVPKAATFNLLGENEIDPNKKSKTSTVKPVSHFKPKVFISLLTDDISMSHDDIPPELARFVRVNRKNEFLPILQNDFLKTRMNDLQEITKNTTKLQLTFNYSPIGIGKLRLLLHVEHAISSLKQLGFSKKDVDEVKGIFSDTNVYLLCGTIFVGSIHILFDFLSFKNDVAFWRKKKSYAGLSLRTTLWRGFSQIIIFLYLVDENTSMLVLIPAGIGTIIELWKCKKILKIEITMSGLRIKTAAEDSDTILKAEQRTKEVDREAMIYLSYILYPLCICGAVYSLLYQPHKSWYSWTLNSMVNGVYAFGFLFMLPQLFINYKLKSVAALPWRAFMYKAFNTFIDDIFAFIITMPTAHRLACFRDDIVFLIYLYQRWLYPVDVNRIDDGKNIAEFEEETNEKTALVDTTKTKKSSKNHSAKAKKIN